MVLAAHTAAKAAAVIECVPQLVRYHQQTIEESAVRDLEEVRPPRGGATSSRVVQASARRSFDVVQIYVVNPIRW